MNLAVMGGQIAASMSRGENFSHGAFAHHHWWKRKGGSISPTQRLVRAQVGK